jgi:hypothetical protein
VYYHWLRWIAGFRHTCKLDLYDMDSPLFLEDVRILWIVIKFNACEHGKYNLVFLPLALSMGAQIQQILANLNTRHLHIHSVFHCANNGHTKEDKHYIRKHHYDHLRLRSWL